MPLSLKNSTTANILAGQSWTGDLEDCSQYSTLYYNCICDAELSCTIRTGSDATMNDTYSFTIAADTYSQGVYRLPSKYFRVHLTNGTGSDTTSLKFQCIVDTEPAVVDLNPTGTLTVASNVTANVTRHLTVSTTGLELGTGATLLSGLAGFHLGLSDSFLKVYDKGSAPTNSDTPQMTFKVQQSADFAVYMNPPVAFANGIWIRATDLIADSNNDAPSGQIVMHGFTN